MKPKLSKNSASINCAWKLISFEIRKKNGDVTYPFGKNAQGSLIYTDSGRFSAQVMRQARPKFSSGDQMKGTAQEIKENFEGCIAYYGHYELDIENGFIIHHVEGSLFPNWEGGEQIRFCDELSGNRIKLSTPPILLGEEIVATLVWERIG